MLNNPPINELEKKAGSRYMLVSAVAKRARKEMDFNAEINSSTKKSGDKSASSEPVSDVSRKLMPDNLALDYAVQDFYSSLFRIKPSTKSEDSQS